MAKDDKIGQLIDQSMENILTGGLSDQPRHDLESYDSALSAKQTRAIELLLAGFSVTEAAKQLGIRRQTLSHWVNNHYNFNATMEAERRALWQRSRDALMSLTTDALRVVRKYLEENNLSAAIAILKAVGIGDRQLVMAADAARGDELEKESRKLQFQIFKDALANYSDPRLKESTSNPPPE